MISASQEEAQHLPPYFLLIRLINGFTATHATRHLASINLCAPALLAA
jgi:hypothetical protein